MCEQIARIAGVGHCGEHGTLAHRWTTWKAEFELYVTASGISDATQKKALYFTLLDPESEIFSIIQFLPRFAGAQKTTTRPWKGSRSISSTERMLLWLDRPL